MSGFKRLVPDKKPLRYCLLIDKPNNQPQARSQGRLRRRGDGLLSPRRERADLIAQTTVRNQLLGRCTASDFALLARHLVLEALAPRQVVIEAFVPIRDLVFPESGCVSVLAGNGEHQVELCAIGREGLVGAVPVLLSSDRVPNRSVVQTVGTGLRIGADALIAAVQRSATLRTLLLNYVLTLCVQSAQAAYAGLAHNLEARLARWLLMRHDRTGRADVAVTHEFLAMALGVQRSSITVTIQVMEGRHLIRARRGRIEIADRSGLESLAGDSYGLPEAEYARLIGVD